VVSPSRYLTLNGKYLRDSEELLAAGDYPQASEKLWGAAAQAVKAVAATRRWRHSSHRDLRRAISRIYRETRDPDYLEFFSVAESLHTNFYEDFLEPEDVNVYADRVKNLVTKLQSLAA
jgi:Archaeal PaREP1/PaREP8 family